MKGVLAALAARCLGVQVLELPVETLCIPRTFPPAP